MVSDLQTVWLCTTTVAWLAVIRRSGQIFRQKSPRLCGTRSRRNKIDFFLRSVAPTSYRSRQKHSLVPHDPVSNRTHASPSAHKT